MSVAADLRIVLVVDEPGAAAEAWPLVQALLARGHDVHLGLGGADDERLLALLASAPRQRLTVGHAPGRLDRWRRLRRSTAVGPLRAAAPADAAILAYLRQLDPDLVLVQAPESELGAEYVLAAAALPVRWAEPPKEGALVERVEELAAQPPPKPHWPLLRPMAALVRAVGFPDDGELAGEDAPASGGALTARLQRAFAARLFPWLMQAPAAWLPDERMLTRELLRDHFGKAELARLAAADETLAKIRQTHRPLLIGPWLGDAAHELIYWIPFLHWLRKALAIDKLRLNIVGWGGKSAWYQHLMGRYVDAAEMMSPAEAEHAALVWRQGAEAEKAEIAQALAERAAQRLGLRRSNLVGPGLMAQVYGAFWKERSGLAQFERHALAKPLAIKPRRIEALTADLPGRYLVIHFPAGPSFPDTGPNRRFVRELIETLARRWSLVGLDPAPWTRTGAADLSADLPGVRRLPLQDDLSAQAAVLQGADAFVGVFGGAAALAALQGKTGVCLASAPDQVSRPDLLAAAAPFQPAHGRLHLLAPGDVGLIADLLGRVSAQPPSRRDVTAQP